LLLSGTTIPVPSSPSSMTSARTGESIDITGQPVRGQTIASPPSSPVPPLDAQQLALANTLVPVTPVPWRCSGCRQHGHILYTCPYLPYAIRMYFAYANHLYQQEPEQVLFRQKKREERERSKGKAMAKPGAGPSTAPTILRRPDAEAKGKKAVAFNAGSQPAAAPVVSYLGVDPTANPETSSSDSSSQSGNE